METLKSDELKSQIKGLDAEDAAPSAPAEGAQAPAAPTPEPATTPEAPASPEPAAAPEPAPDTRNETPLVKDLRRKLDEANKRARELEERVRTPREPAAGEDRTPAAPLPETPAPGPEDHVTAFSILEKANRALRGEIVRGLEDTHKAESLRKLALDVIRSMSPEEIYAVQEKAETGSMGPAGDAIAAMAREEMVGALARARTNERAAAEEHTARTEYQGKVEEQFKGVYEKYPDLLKREPGKESKAFKFVQQWFHDNVGTPTKPGLFFGAAQRDPSNIGRLFDRAMQDFRFQEMESASADRNRLQNILDRQRSPGGGGLPAGESRNGGSASDQLKQQLVERAGITDY